MSTALRVFKKVTVTSATAAAMLAASATSAFADTTPAVSASAHVRYSVNGTTVAVTPYLTGTQHEMQNPDGSLVKSALPQSFSVKTPASAKWVSGSAAGESGEIVCGKTGSVPLMSASLSAQPIVLKFPGPGTYPVTLTADVCTPQGSVTKTVNIVIPAAGAAPVATSHDAGAKKAAAAKAGKTGSIGQQGIPAAPGEKEAKAHAAAGSSTPVVGPHVETDRQGQSSDSSMLWGLAGLAGLSALAGSSVLAARRRS